VAKERQALQRVFASPSSTAFSSCIPILPPISLETKEPMICGHADYRGNVEGRARPAHNGW
jgi:hypothetical protein